MIISVVVVDCFYDVDFGNVTDGVFVVTDIFLSFSVLLSLSSMLLMMVILSLLLMLLLMMVLLFLLLMVLLLFHRDKTELFFDRLMMNL